MLKISGGALARAMHYLGLLKGTQIALVASFGQDSAEQKLEVETAAGAEQHLHSLRDECALLDVPVTIAQIDRLVRHLSCGKCSREDFNALLESLEGRLFDEIALRHVFVLEPKEAGLYNGADFPENVAIKFPSAAYDLDEAAKCLAFGRATASVFHLMRAVEVALRAVHSCLGISVALDGQDRNWGNICKRIREDIKQRGTNFAERDKFQEIYAMLDAVKDAWRNKTMHLEDKKTEEEAAAILFAVRGFLQKVADRMDENGLPKV